MPTAAAPSPRRREEIAAQPLRAAGRAGVGLPAQRPLAGAARPAPATHGAITLRGPAAGIPDPHPALVTRLAVQALEVVDGTRSIAGLSGWISQEVAEHLIRMRTLHAERRTVYGDGRRTAPTPGRVAMGRPRVTAVEAAVVMHTSARSFAVAIRMEYVRRRWRATCIAVL
ncbi:hypothetical protein JD276_13095 [Leucobacter sp. CSA1]|uniref:Uncharacterized protein n=1 Tax=Leucobacter chromiisoli TaxID=2796471 RepID=A0A934QAY3_9MICO|nr:Rv3235 family protein [Leucobacter chromiisoli]MBK0419967.1 hypothetical protein [Leucobacter chromiisoli]